MKRKWSDMKKEKIRQKQFLILLLSVLFILGGCGTKESEEKVRDLEFTVAKESELPEALQQQIEEKKEGAFQFTYSDNEYLYVAKGYGIQETGGYSISVENCYLSKTAICVKTRLQGPAVGEEVTKAPSYPYIVLKLELREEEVLFQ